MAMTLGAVNPYVNRYNSINNSTQKTFQTIATGSMHPTAAMGASEYAILARLDSNTRATSQSIQNTQNLSAMVKTAAGATGNTVSALTQIKDQLINAANDSNGSVDRAAIQEGINQLVGQINENAYVEYNGKRLVDGSQSTLTLAGIDGYENFNLGDIRSEALGLTDADGNITIDASTVESANNSLAVVDRAIDVARGSLTSLEFMEDFYYDAEGNYIPDDSALGRSLDEATTQGAQLQRMEYQQANYTTMEENQLAAQSTMGDADIARQITQLRNEQTQEQLALFATRMFNQNRANILGMLQ